MGVELTKPASKKLSLQELYPPAGKETGLRLRTMGVSTISAVRQIEKNYRCRTYTPRTGEET
jgi:hypothetical protein